jgi:tetratricopeptide (TPR) repeat protein
MTEDPPALLAQAIALHQQGALTPAEALYRRALAAAPRQPDALHLLGVLIAQRGRPADAIPLIAAAIAEAPDNATFHANLGRARKAANHPAEALASFERAIQLGSADPGVFNDRGNLLRDLQRPDAALESFDRAIALRPDYAEAYSDRGNALHDLGRSPGALDSYARAIALRPDYAEAFNNRGNALHDLDRHQEALASYARALALRPDYPDALANRAGVLSVLGEHTAALQSYEQALVRQPDHPAARFGRSFCLLQQGDLARGWPEYEWRWRMPRQTERTGRLAQPPWLGAEPLGGKTILVHAEQGFGDTLQFCRYATPLAERAAHVLLVVPRPLARLLVTLDGPAKVLSAGDRLPSFDLHCPLLSLPLALGTTLGTIPPPARLTPPPDRVAAWDKRLAPLPTPRIGLCWAGSPRHDDPVARAIDRRRSITLAHYAPLAGVSGATFVALQKGEAAAQATDPPAGLPVHDWTAELRDFADTAALIEALDLVITVDTAVAHLAATLGKPTWILNRLYACWRWLLDRNDSPWYPTVRLFRQPAPGDWRTVIDAVSTAFRDFTPHG